MPMIRINAEGPGAVLHRSSRLVECVLQQTQDIRGPVIIMTHGYKYRPDNSATCPHRHILALRPRALPDYSPSWPQHLGFGSGFTDEGLAVAFGWNARGPLWTAQRRAQSAGRVLADVINRLHRLNPDRPIHFIGHSMGVELAIEALHHICPGALKRFISMTGATYRARVLAALASEAGRRSELINITSRENDLFDFLYEQLVQPPQPGDRSVGAGIDAENAVTLQIDCNTTLAHLSHMIAPIGHSQRRVCHWSSYTRPGALRVYNALLREPQRLSLAALRHGLPNAHAHRWSRLFATPKPRALLPFAQKAS